MTLGVDLGGTKIETALVDETGKILASHRCATDPANNPDIIIADIFTSAGYCLERAGKEAQAIGVGAAGQIDKNGVVRFSPNLEGWHNVPLRDRLADNFALPVVITNDVRAITIGEWRHGAGKGVSDLVCVFVGTGVGGGVVSGGRLLEGCGNSAAELGHITIVVGGRRCHCGGSGCLEAYAGGWAIAERAREAVRTDPDAGKALIAIAGYIENISSATVTSAYRENDPLAKRLFLETADYLAAGLVSIVNAFNPCLVITGGGVINGTPEYLPLVEPIVRSNALRTATENLKIVTSALGSKAGVIGAAALARDFISGKEHK